MPDITIETAAVSFRFEAPPELVAWLRRTNERFLSRAQSAAIQVQIEPMGKPAEPPVPALEVSAPDATFLFTFRSLKEWVTIVANPEAGVYRLRCWRPEASASFGWIEFYLYLVQYLALLSRGRIVTHAAGILHRSRAALVIGPGGAGKSTVAAMFPASQVLHEDTVILDTSGPRVSVFGSPYRTRHKHGGWNEASPAAALLFLRQADRTALEPISKGQALAGLFLNVFGPNCRAARELYSCSPTWRERELGCVQSVAARVPAFTLDFDLRYSQLMRCFDEAVERSV